MILAMQRVQDELVKIEHVLDALNCGAALIDRAGVFIHANPRLCAMISRPRATLMGRNVREFYESETERDFLESTLRHVDEPREYEFVLPRADGSRLPVVIGARPLPPPLDSLHVVTITDISRQKSAEADLREDMQLLTQVGDNALEHALELKDYSETLEEQVRKRTEDLRKANLDAITMLAIASEAKDADTGRHVRRIQRFAERLALELGLSRDEAHTVGYSAILHDVGKIHVPDDILKKPGPLTDNERFVMKQHTLFGERILSKRPFFERARNIARSHHENWDGSGYPDGLVKAQIPLDARIVHVVDVYDALTQPRVYKRAWTQRETIDFIANGAGTFFDRDAARAFKSLVASGEIDKLAKAVEPIDEL